jgi:SRSO17 transposase
VKQLAESLAASSWENASWREGTKQRLRSRFAALRVRIAHRDYWRSELPAEEWLLIEWPRGENKPTKYWLSTLPADSKLVDLVRLAKHRWIIERDYEEQELGLGHYEGRGWRGAFPISSSHIVRQHPTRTKRGLNRFLWRLGRAS